MSNDTHSSSAEVVGPSAKRFDTYLVGGLTVFCSVIGLALFTAFMTGGLNPIGAAFIGALSIGMGLVCLARFTIGGADCSDRNEG